ncbi:EndoU domain-containing protein [Glycomyces tenuis]|uniref:EndoU domain-containing protein n=1 Tax=Glycomyces tenuis TaxID=58116 RepID=UPI0003FDCCC4|nr:EndoU domain-containing protein [Glycomyces tenuis]
MRALFKLIVVVAIALALDKTPGPKPGPRPGPPRVRPHPKGVTSGVEATRAAFDQGEAGGGSNPSDPGNGGNKPKNPWDDPAYEDARYDMTRFGEMGDGTMDKVWDGDGRGNGDHKPTSTEPGKTKFPPGTTKQQVEAWFKSIATNPDGPPQARPHGDGWVVTGTRDGITCVVTLDKDGSISGGHPVSGEGVTTNPPPPPR